MGTLGPPNCLLQLAGTLTALSGWALLNVDLKTTTKTLGSCEHLLILIIFLVPVESKLHHRFGASVVLWKSKQYDQSDLSAVIS